METKTDPTKADPKPHPNAAEYAAYLEAEARKNREMLGDEPDKIDLKSCILTAWAASHLSEGQASKALGVDRVQARTMLQDAIDQGVKAVEASSGVLVEKEPCCICEGLFDKHTALGMVAQERVRQVAKGFDAAHDAKHTDGSILVAGYLIAGREADETHGFNGDFWPVILERHVFEKYKADPIRRLVIAASMIVAEIDRRIAPKPNPEGPGVETAVITAVDEDIAIAAMEGEGAPPAPEKPESTKIRTDALGFPLTVNIVVSSLMVRGKHTTHENQAGQVLPECEHTIAINASLPADEVCEVVAHEVYHLFYSVRHLITADEETEAQVFGQLVKRVVASAASTTDAPPVPPAVNPCPQCGTELVIEENRRHCKACARYFPKPATLCVGGAPGCPKCGKGFDEQVPCTCPTTTPSAAEDLAKRVDAFAHKPPRGHGGTHSN